MHMQKRLQQPPVYINPNLMKVKMESDYMPIVTPKEEPAEDTNIPDVSVTVVNEERETEKKKEETIAKLTDKIKKYSERISSFVREKTDIKTTLEKEMSQLNLVNEKLKTENERLNSTATAQRDEIIQLNHKLDQQQEQIGKLNRKLKLQGENQNQQTAENPSSNSNSSSDSEANSNPVQMGFGDFPTKVLSRIFDHLDLKSVKKSRFVCRQWRKEAGKILLSKFYVVCSYKRKCETALQNYIKNSHSTERESGAASASESESAPTIKLKSVNVDRTLGLLNQFPMLRDLVRELKFSSPHSSTKNLYKILPLLPNLQVLDTNTLDSNLELLIQKLERLEKLKLDFPMEKETAIHFLRHHQRFASVKSLEIHAAGMGIFSDSDFLGHGAIEHLRITRFTLDVLENYKDNTELTRWFLRRISPSLQHLKLIADKDIFRSPSSLSASEFSCEPWNDDWMIPLGLNRVETMEIGFRPQEISPGLNEFLLKNILVALRLPRLRKLAVDFIPWELEDIIYQWNSHESASANGRTLSTESLEELEILSTFAKSAEVENYSAIPGAPWHRLKSLKCTWNITEPFDPSVFSELRNLERLEVNMVFPLDFVTVAADKEFHLRDLKSLKSFGLKVPWNTSQVYQDYAQDLLERELRFTTSLQLVQLHRVVIDDEPLKCLKSALGPNAPIIIFTN